MNFDIPQDLADYQKELDDFIESEIKPLQAENDNLVSVQGDFAGLDGQLSWGPEGYQLAFAYFDGHDTEIGVVDFYRSSFYQLTDNDVDDLMPAWQPGSPGRYLLAGQVLESGEVIGGVAETVEVVDGGGDCPIPFVDLP